MQTFESRLITGRLAILKLVSSPQRSRLSCCRCTCTSGPKIRPPGFSSGSGSRRSSRWVRCSWPATGSADEPDRGLRDRCGDLRRFCCVGPRRCPGATVVGCSDLTLVRYRSSRTRCFKASGSLPRSSSWRCAGICGSVSPIAMSRSSWPSAGSRSITSRCSGGCNASRRSSRMRPPLPARVRRSLVRGRDLREGRRPVALRVPGDRPVRPSHRTSTSQPAATREQPDGSSRWRSALMARRPWS